METYIINGHEIEYDTFDLTNMELFESERRFAMERATDLQKVTDENAVDTMREMCEMVRDFFDVLLGEGSSEKFFGTGRNIVVEMSALTKFLQEVSANVEQAANSLAFDTLAHPPMNRQQRRDAQRKAEREKRRQEAIQRAAAKTGKENALRSSREA